jgi:hypothetical protein
MVFCRRRMPAVYAFIAALLAGIACNFYATEGRGFGMVLGCAAGALLCWQTAAGSKPRVLAVSLLALCLVLMIALNYYSIFFLAPMALAELVRWRTLKKELDLAIVCAMAPALVVLAVHFPLIAAARRYLLHHWSSASWRQIPDFYVRFSLVSLAAILVAVTLRGFSESSGESVPRKPVLPLHEWVAIGALALMPVGVVAVSKYTTHVFVFRYALWAVIGFAILTAAVLRLTSSSQPLIGLAMLGLLMPVIIIQQFSDLREGSGLRQGEAVWRELRCLPDGSEPIVIGYNHVFMELSYYAEPRLRRRIVYPLSRSLDLRYKGFDLDFLNLSALRQRTKLPIVDLDTFLGANPRFILAAHPEDYLPGYLLSAGYRLVPMSSAATPILYEVEAPGSY